jgi:exo-1,4-beta-D-glucosaminidase
MVNRRWTRVTLLAVLITAAAGLPAGTVRGVAAVAAPAASVTVHTEAVHTGAVHTGGGDITAGWRIQTSAVRPGTGDTISLPGYDASTWLPISRPETLMAALLENGRYPDIFRSDNLAKVPTDQFKVNWWYRDQLRLRVQPGRHTFLTMRGVLSRANLWINGTKIADQSLLQGSYSRFEYDVTPYVRDGANAIALEVFPNDSSNATGYLTLNMVDWNQPSPDNWTGLQFAPRLVQDGAVSVRDVHVVQDTAADLKRSNLTVKAQLRNNTAAPVTTTFRGAVSRRGFRASFHKNVTIPAGATVPVGVTPADARALSLRRPAVWWPYQMGGQPLYHLDVAAVARGAVSDRAAEDFGIRTVTSSLTPVVPGRTLGADGYLKYTINGKPLIIRGGGWSQELFLRYDPRNIADQLAYIRDLGLNTIRFEGNFPPEDMYAQMDRAGILNMPGWQCCNKWEQRSGRWNDEIKASAANQAGAVARVLRDHPSVFTFFQGSDNEPDPAKEAIYLTAFAAADWRTPQIASAEYKSSARLGPAGAKEGPYNWVPPGYWWHNGPEMSNPDDAFTNAGGAFGFDTETSAGNTVPTSDSLARFLTPADRNQIWDPAGTRGVGTGPDIFHTSPYNDYTAVGRMGQYNTPLWNRYGPWTDEASYQRAAQAGGYEIARAEFEAYLGHADDPANPSTGVIYWQMNKAWPSLQWELYGFDLDQPGVYFGAKKAGEPVHVQYAYDTGAVRVVNLTGGHQDGLRVRADVIDLAGRVVSTSQAPVAGLASQEVRTVLAPVVPAGISATYFLRLTLSRGHRTVSRNVYWLST